MGLTREKVPGLVTALYLTLGLSALFYAFNTQGEEASDWGLALITLTFPWSFVFLFLDYLWRRPWQSSYSPLFIVWLFLVFMTANAFVLHRACRHIFRED